MQVRFLSGARVLHWGSRLDVFITWNRNLVPNGKGYVMAKKKSAKAASVDVKRAENIANQNATENASPETMSPEEVTASADMIESEENAEPAAPLETEEVLGAAEVAAEVQEVTGAAEVAEEVQEVLDAAEVQEVADAAEVAEEVQEVPDAAEVAAEVQEVPDAVEAFDEAAQGALVEVVELTDVSTPELKKSSQTEHKDKPSEKVSTPKTVKAYATEHAPHPSETEMDVEVKTGTTSMQSTSGKKSSTSSGKKVIGTQIRESSGKAAGARKSAVKETKKENRKVAVKKKATASSEIKETGQFGKGHTTTRKSVGAYIVDDLKEFGAWCKKNYSKAIPLGIMLILVIVIAVILIRNAMAAKEENQVASNENVFTDVAVDYTHTPVEENAYDFLNQFVKQYYDVSATGDIAQYGAMRNLTSRTEEICMSKKADYIDSYNIVSVYTKPGPEENSYIAYVYYEVYFKGFDTPAPGMNKLYICTDADGKLYVNALEDDADVNSYIERVSAEEDVADLFNKIQVNYNDIVDSDEELKAFLEELSVNLKNDVGEELALLYLDEPELLETADEATQAPAVDEETEAPEEDADEGDAGEDADDGADSDVETVSTTDRVNVRAEASTDAEKLGTVSKGTTFTRLENLASGWSKISYEGQDGYIRNDFLIVVETPKGYVKTNDKVNVRTEPSTDGSRLGVASSGTILGLVEHRSDGWSKIIYNGQAAYIKTEFLEDIAQ